MGLRHESRRYDRICAAQDLIAITYGQLQNDRERLSWNYPVDCHAEIIANIKRRIARSEELIKRYKRQLD